MSDLSNTKTVNITYNVVYDVCVDGERFIIGNGSKVKVTVSGSNKEYFIIFNKIEDSNLFFKEAVVIKNYLCFYIPLNIITSFSLVNN